MAYTFAFSSIAKTLQVRLQKGADIEHLAELDHKFWLMLSCGVSAMGPEGEAVAKALDTDADGRVRVPEILAAIDWLKPRLRSFDRLFVPTTALSQADIAEATPEAEPLLRLFQKLAPEDALTPATIDAAFAAFRATVANGDSVVPVSAVDTKFAPVGEAILAVTGGAPAVEGGVGIDKGALEAFDKALEAYKAWRAAQPQVAMPEGIAPATAVAAVTQLAPKVAAFFHACALVRYNPAVREALIAPVQGEALADAPLALPAAEATALPFVEGINPHDAATWATAVAVAQAVEPKAKAMTEDLWAKVQAAVAPFDAWASSKPDGADVFAGLDEQVFALAGEPAVREAFTKALEEDAAQAPLAAAFDDLNRLLVLRIGLLRFLRNFVNVEDLYPPKASSLFQMGTLYMDGRSCTLCLPIDKAAAAHAGGAKLSNCCLAYCTITRPAEKKTATLCAVFTAGSAETLTVGLNGLFVDLKGQDWEATITHVVPNAMSLWEAFFAPWRKIGAAFTGTIRKMVAGRGEAATAAMTTKATAAANAAADPKAAAPAPNTGAAMASVATLGIALSFVATALTGVVSALTNTPLWKTGVAILGIVLVVSFPSVILTWCRLRARNLAPIFNASGWAVNRHIGLTPTLGRFFTQRANYIGKKFVPAPQMLASTRIWKRLGWGIVILAVLAAGWYFFCPTSPRQKAKACEATPACEAVAPVEVTPAAETNATVTVEAPAPAATPAATPAPEAPATK